MSRSRWSRKDKTRGICITLAASTLEQIDNYMELYNIESRSALIDMAIREFISSKTSKKKEAV